MDFITLTHDNLGREHICCAISNERDPQVRSKKEWLSERLDEGLIFRKADVRGKCFIEYLPAEAAWVPVTAPGYLLINCFWVSGQCKGHGYASALLDSCIRDGKERGKKGICVISSPKKQAFLSDPAFLTHKGFRLADTAEPFFTLLYLPFSEGADAPRFRECAKHPQAPGDGFVLFYTHACPYTAKYVPLTESAAAREGIPFRSVLLDSRETAQSAPVAWTNYALFYNGQYVTNEIQSEAKFLKLAETLVGNR